jgi:Gamma tubulin complex component C-terminal
MLNDIQVLAADAAAKEAAAAEALEQQLAEEAEAAAAAAVVAAELQRSQAAAAAALTLQYTRLGEAADARAAAALWRARSLERLPVAKTALAELRAAEEAQWAAEHDTAAAAAATAAAATAAAAAAAASEHAQRTADSDDVLTDASTATAAAAGDDEVLAADASLDTAAVAVATDDTPAVYEAGGGSAQVSALLSSSSSRSRVTGTTTAQQSQVVVAPAAPFVRVTKEPGGGSEGMSTALQRLESYSNDDSAAAAAAAAAAVLQRLDPASMPAAGAVCDGADFAAHTGAAGGGRRHSVVKITQQPGASSSAAAHALTWAEPAAVSDTAAVAAAAAAAAVVDREATETAAVEAQRDIVAAAAATAAAAEPQYRSFLMMTAAPELAMQPTALDTYLSVAARAYCNAEFEGVEAEHTHTHTHHSSSSTSCSEDSSPWHELPLDVLAQECIEAPVLAQCEHIDRVVLAYLTQDRGLLDHLQALRRFYLGFGAGFLHDFAGRLYEGLCGNERGTGYCDWRHQHNLSEAMQASAAATRLDEAQHFAAFTYSNVNTAAAAAVAASSSSQQQQRRELPPRSQLDPHSPTALAFVTPRYALPWPLGVVVTRHSTEMYTAVHSALFAAHMCSHRLRELYQALRSAANATTNSGSTNSTTDQQQEQLLMNNRLRRLHVFRHELQHLSACFTAHLATQGESGWSELCSALKSGAVQGGIAALETAHTQYIDAIHRRCFLGQDTTSISVRACVQQFYEVVCSVSRHVARSSSIDSSGSVSGVCEEQCFAALMQQQQRFAAVCAQLRAALCAGTVAELDSSHMQALLVRLGYDIESSVF